jgi:hypothetical protein
VDGRQRRAERVARLPDWEHRRRDGLAPDRLRRVVVDGRRVVVVANGVDTVVDLWTLARVEET